MLAAGPSVPHHGYGRDGRRSGAHPAGHRDVSRRGVLRGAAVLAAAASVPVPTWLRSRAFAARPAVDPITMALHVHASFSEGGGSIASQLTCARAAGVDVVWFTEHDWRMIQHNYRTQMSFDSLRDEKQFSKGWTWKPVQDGHPAAVAGGIVSSPVSPNDPSTIAGALRAYVEASDSAAGDSYLWYAETDPSRHNYRGNLTGTTLTLDVFPTKSGPDAWGELRIMLSNHPPSNGRPAGRCMLSYRFGRPGRSSADGFIGSVPVAAPNGRWTTVTLDPISDIRALWPELVAEDNSLCLIWIGATARNGATADVVVDNLQFHRAQPVSISPFDLQASILEGYRDLFSDITTLAGQEVSFLPEHLGWLGGDDFVFDYDPDKLDAKDIPSDANSRARTLAARGGAIAINHPFGADGSAIHSNPTAIEDLATQYLTYGAYGATMLEVGYAQRGGASLEDHLAVWDALSRNGLYLTGTGVNDNHDGMDFHGSTAWLAQTNRFATSVWAAAPTQDDLLAELRSGRCYTSEVTQPGLLLDVYADGVAMGAVSVRPDLTSRQISVDARNLPAGGTVSLVQGAVDYAGVADPHPNSAVIDVLSARDFHGSTATATVGCRSSSYVRAVVSDGDGRGVAVSNPIWLLHERSRTAVPVERQAADSSW